MTGHPSLTAIARAVALLKAAQATGYAPAAIGGYPEKK